MKLRNSITLGFAGALALGSTGCIIREGGLHAWHPIPPSPPVVQTAPEVVVVQQRRDIIVTPPRAVVVHPRIVHPQPPPPPPPIVVVTPAPAPPPVVVVTSPRAVPQTPAGHVPPGLAKKQNVTYVFTTQERDVIHGHFKKTTVTTTTTTVVQGQGPGRGHNKVPPGLAKKAHRDLSPGWERTCVVGAVMPQEVYRQCEPLPQEVVVKLPPPPAGTIVVTIDTKVVRLARATLEILDVFDLF